ncbi:MAG TPA: hypothetical protein VHR72_10555, partial [Gemmataceae bacterium]|nr:hypothetical protein [Gemmataceae bacterium]
GDETQDAFAARAREIARQEGIDGLPTSVYRQAVAASQGNMRRVLQRIESGSFKADALVALEREFEMCRSTKGEHGERRRAELTAAMKGLR